MMGETIIDEIKHEENHSAGRCWKRPYTVFSERADEPSAPKKSYAWVPELVAICVLSGIGGSVLEHEFGKPKVAPIELRWVSEGGSVTSAVTIPEAKPSAPWGGFHFSYSEAKSGPEYDAARAAAAAWSSAIGVTIKAPRLIVTDDRGACGGKSAYACAWIGTDTIVVPETIPNGYETETIMHEIGHLLGVQHLSGDPLMGDDGIDQAKPALTAPSKAAIALAKTYRMWKDPRFPLK